jgi:hypothetical protein
VKHAKRRVDVELRRRSVRQHDRHASAAAPPSVRLRAAADMPRKRGSNSWRTTPHAYATSRSEPRALATATLRACAASRASSRRLVFPIPAGPSSATTCPRPATASSSASTMTLDSGSRS